MTDGQYVELDDARVFLTARGTGEPVLLLHGLAFDQRVWRHQVQTLSPHFRVICPDLLGFGRSSAITGPFSHTRTLEQVITRLGHPRVHIVGHSLGGRIAGEFVQTYPDRVASLTLAAADLGGVPLPTVGPNIRKVFELGKLDIPAAKRAFIELPVFDVLRRQAEPFAFFEQMVADYSGWLFANASRGLERRPETPTCELLETFAIPTLVLLGEAEHEDFFRIADEVLRRVPGAVQQVIPNAGHVPNLEQPERFSAALLEFLKRASRAAGKS
ncbi:MAG TPA: alpha/beta hydrolase [Polyangiaceae bacterium]|nr:alpha/beta hydrolase [Polyangiaceae bacterium]